MPVRFNSHRRYLDATRGFKRFFFVRFLTEKKEEIASATTRVLRQPTLLVGDETLSGFYRNFVVCLLFYESILTNSRNNAISLSIQNRTQVTVQNVQSMDDLRTVFHLPINDAAKKVRKKRHSSSSEGTKQNNRLFFFFGPKKHKLALSTYLLIWGCHYFFCVLLRREKCLAFHSKLTPPSSVCLSSSSVCLSNKTVGLMRDGS